MTNQFNCQCSCGATQFNISGKALLRGYCHCTICQEFNQASFADITLFHANDVRKPKDNAVKFRSHKSPPVLQRGLCISCGHAAIEYLNIPGLPEVVIVPSTNIQVSSFIPAPSLHIFYDKRQADVNDQLPKYKGFLKSEMVFGYKVMQGLWTRRKLA